MGGVIMGQKVADFETVTNIVEATDYLWMVRTSDGTDKKISMSSLITALGGRTLGELFSSRFYTAPSATFPALCLSSIETYLDISTANWPDLVPELRTTPAYYMHNKTGAKYLFDVTDWDITSNVATLTLEDDDPENGILSVLDDDYKANGSSYTNWLPATLPSAIGDITAGDYAITGHSTSSRTISFAFTASDNSGSVTETIAFYPHRIPGSTTTARLFAIDGYAIMSEGSDRVSGFRKLDQMQQITGTLDVNAPNGVIGGISAPGYSESGAFSGSTKESARGTTPSATYDGWSIVDFDSANSPNARTSATTDGETRPRNIAAYIYMWGRTYNS